MGMDIVHDLLSKMGRIKRELVSPKPTGQSEYSMMLVGDLLNRRRRNIGAIRVYVTVPAKGNDIKYTIEWTRHAFGFWYRKEMKLRNAVEDPAHAKIGLLRSALDPVQWTADGTVKLASMNKMFRKIKKSRVRDRAARSGLMVG
jgi:hypothetical protein